MAPKDLSRLAIFPLPRALLFPNAVLPLHVFEPRYRQLLADCLASDGIIGIACLHGGDPSKEPDDDFELPGSNDLERPLVRRLVGVGTIVAHEALEDGRSNIILKGLGRARIDDELPIAPGRAYRRVQAIWVRDHVLPSEHEASARQTLVALAGELADRLPEGGDTLRSLVGSQPNAGALSDLLAAALVTAPEERLRMFETVDVQRRSDGVAEAIATALATLADPDQAMN